MELIKVDFVLVVISSFSDTISLPLSRNNIDKPVLDKAETLARKREIVLTLLTLSRVSTSRGETSFAFHCAAEAELIAKGLEGEVEIGSSLYK